MYVYIYNKIISIIWIRVTIETNKYLITICKTIIIYLKFLKNINLKNKLIFFINIFTNTYINICFK